MIEAFGVGLGTFFQLLTTVFSGGIFAAILTFFVKWRGMSLTAEATLRTHFGDELKRLAQNVHDCEEDKRLMRAEINALHDEVRGLTDQLRMYSTDRLLRLEASTARPSETAPHAVAAAQRLRDK